MRISVIALFAALTAGAAQAQEAFLVEKLGILGLGRMFVNDAYGDRKDRWHTGTYTLNIMTGKEWTGTLSSKPFDIIEYRLRSDIIAPQTLNGANSNDRAYVGALTAGVHTYYDLGGYDVSAGVDVTFVGPQTGLASFQDHFHKLLKMPQLGQNVINNQIGNATYVTGTLEFSKDYELSDNVTFRPFFEGRVGIEDVARIGGDMIFGSASDNDLLLRDSLTGSLYKGIEYGDIGWTAIVGADVAHTSDSAFFPASFGTTAKPVTYRARAGVEYQRSRYSSFYYGATYLSEEYVGQPSGQIVGALRFSFNF